LVVAAGIAVTQPRLEHALRRHTSSGLNKATGGRASLIAVGIRIAEAHPSRGVGLGGFEHAYSKRTGKQPEKSASHNTPVTVAAEEGAPGLLLFLWLVVALLLAAYRRVKHRTYGTVARAPRAAMMAAIVPHL